MPRRTSLPKSFAIIKKARNEEEREQYGALIETLSAVAHNTGHRSWQDLGYTVLVQIANDAAAGIDEIAATNAALHAVAVRFRSNFKRRIRQLSGDNVIEQEAAASAAVAGEQKTAA